MAFPLNMDDRGISIVGTVFTLIILGIMGAALVALVATSQESRTISISKERVFYAAQAGFEYALREIRHGGYPIVTSKPLGDAAFSVDIDWVAHRITVVGELSDYRKSYSIDAPQLAVDCVAPDVSGAYVGGASNNTLGGIVLTQTCLDAVTLATITVEWGAGTGKTVKRINVGGADVYSDPIGVDSGVLIDITDYTFTGSVDVLVEFNSSIMGKKVTLTFTFTDSSPVVIVDLHPGGSGGG